MIRCFPQSLAGLGAFDKRIRTLPASCAVLLFFFAAVAAYSTESPSLIRAIPPESKISGEIIVPREMYLIPQTVFVGDQGRLVVSLGPSFEDADSFVLHSFGKIPEISDLAISRIELEKRNSQIRLLIDFVSYAPGVFTFPPLRIPRSGGDPLVLGGLEITVASILTPDIMVLSEPALPLTVPGTGFIVYGGAGALLLVLAAGMGGFFWSWRLLGPFRERQKRRKLFASLEQHVKDFQTGEKDALREKELFSLLAGEFRGFLSLVTGIDCTVLTPPEFLALPVQVPGSPGPDFLCRLFRRWDELRFSGEIFNRGGALDILNNLESFLTGFKLEEKNRDRRF